MHGWSSLMGSLLISCRSHLNVGFSSPLFVESLTHLEGDGVFPAVANLGFKFRWGPTLEMPTHYWAIPAPGALHFACHHSQLRLLHKGHFVSLHRPACLLGDSGRPTLLCMTPKISSWQRPGRKIWFSVSSLNKKQRQHCNNNNMFLSA